ncbi:TapY2 family type IVa secretion system protein [Shewanella sp.]|nr:TapY2 family type IVa secretion system protein [Shewanella sp.]
MLEMKRINICLFLMLPQLLFAVVAKPSVDKLDYKCFVQVSGEHYVRFYRWPVKLFPVKVTSLVGQSFIDKRGNTAFIKQVKECVPVSDPFKSQRANRQDALTLR